MAIHVQPADRVRRDLLRRLPKRFRPLPRRAIGIAVCAGIAFVALAGLRLSAPVGPVVSAGPVLAAGALQHRAVELVAPGYVLYPQRIPAEEGWLTVPGDHARPGARTLRVHYTRLPMVLDTDSGQPASWVEAGHAAQAVDPAQAAASPIVYLADSAHGSATGSLVGPDFDAVQALRRLGPVIGFDPRDSAHADPAPYCPGAWGYSADAPLGRASLQQQLAPRVQHCAEAIAVAFAGIRFDLAQSVADLEALRAALGIETLRLLAAGDGTRLALAYLQAHPQRVERALLLSAHAPRQPAPRPEDVESALARALHALRNDPYWKRRLPEPRESLRVAITRLDVQPVEQRVRDPLTGEHTALVLGGADLRLAVLERLGRHDGLQQLGRLLEDVFAGDYATLAETAIAMRRPPPPRAALMAQRCMRTDDAAQARRERMAAAFTLLGDAADLLRQAHCAAWPVAPREPGWTAPASPPPVLFVAGEFDPAAPAEQIEALAAALGGARVLRTSESAPAARLHWALADDATGSGDEAGEVLAFLAGPAQGHIAAPASAPAAADDPVGPARGAPGVVLGMASATEPLPR